jgi:hypothetical protein
LIGYCSLFVFLGKTFVSSRPGHMVEWFNPGSQYHGPVRCSFYPSASRQGLWIAPRFPEWPYKRFHHRRGSPVRNISVLPWRLDVLIGAGQVPADVPSVDPCQPDRKYVPSAAVHAVNVRDIVQADTASTGNESRLLPDEGRG